MHVLGCACLCVRVRVRVCMCVFVCVLLLERFDVQVLGNVLVGVRVRAYAFLYVRFHT